MSESPVSENEDPGILGLSERNLLLAFIAFIALLFLLFGCPKEEDPCPEGKSINGQLDTLLKRDAGTTVKVAPQKPQTGDNKAEPAPPFEEVPADKVFEEILKKSGIDPCNSKPEDFSADKNKGFLDKLDKGDSDVLNEDGSRATFGWFIQVTEGGVTKEYYILFSYDYIVVDGKVLCAFEVFLFGPFERTGTAVVPDPPPLIEGWAVNGDLCLLEEVPPEIASVGNSLNCIRDGEIDAEIARVRADQTLSAEEKANKITELEARKTGNVQTGVDKPLAGCLVCHEQGEGLAQQTVPFPWYKE